ncbi:F-box/kelch-repeat protein SKIP6 [Capsicum chinense]|nr:F-box/kelch-repeat protein SKIP6 [Capsicum chinense]
MPVKPIGPAFAVLGSKIYVIGGSIAEIPSNNVWVFDCRFNCWEMGPRMRIGREFAAAGVANGKIYVMGGDKWMHASAVVGGRVYAMADRGGVVYDVEGCQWRSVSKRLDLGWRGRAAVVGGVLYCYDYLGKIRGYDVKEDVWKELRGVDKGLPKFLCGATMVNFDDKLCVVWEGKGSGKEVDIMCAEIQVWRDEDGGLSGNILWSDMILVVPNGASIVQCLPVDL